MAITFEGRRITTDNQIVSLLRGGRISRSRAQSLLRAFYISEGQSRGDASDNALAETVIGLFKTEVIRRRGPWRSLEAVEFADLDWVDWFNTRRLLEPIGYMPPAEYEARYYEQAAVA